MSNISNVIGRGLQRKCPKIGADKVIGDIKRMVLKCEPFYLGSFSPGDEYTACDYDWPDGKITQLFHGMTKGPVHFRGVECIEINEIAYSPEGDPLSRTRRIIYLTPRFAHTLLSITRRQDGSGFIERSDLAVPLSMDGKSRWKVSEIDSESGAPPIISDQKIDGIWNLHIAKHTTPCLRWMRTRTGDDLAYEEAEEVFVSTETGMTELVRHYIGRGWPKIEDFKLSPKIEIEGHIYYLWFVRKVLR
jgi:hypothetical protein